MGGEGPFFQQPAGRSFWQSDITSTTNHSNWLFGLQQHQLWLAKVMGAAYDWLIVAGSSRGPSAMVSSQTAPWIRSSEDSTIPTCRWVAYTPTPLQPPATCLKDSVSFTGKVRKYSCFFTEWHPKSRLRAVTSNMRSYYTILVIFYEDDMLPFLQRIFLKILCLADTVISCRWPRTDFADAEDPLILSSLADPYCPKVVFSSFRNKRRRKVCLIILCTGKAHLAAPDGPFMKVFTFLETPLSTEYVASVNRSRLPYFCISFNQIPP